MTSRAEGMGSGLVEALFEEGIAMDGDLPLPKCSLALTGKDIVNNMPKQQPAGSL